jgi:hypothetical protein
MGLQVRGVSTKKRLAGCAAILATIAFIAIVVLKAFVLSFVFLHSSPDLRSMYSVLWFISLGGGVLVCVLAINVCRGCLRFVGMLPPKAAKFKKSTDIKK